MLYVLSTSLYKSYQVDKFIKTAEDENAKLEVSNTALKEDYEYYSSDAYKEKIAKQNFGLIRPGEEVIILSKTSETKTLVNERRAVEISQEYYKSLSNPRKWFLFFFDRERFAL